jgi:hypothetical protein
MMVRCNDCKWSEVIDSDTRFSLSQENKEILNMLLRSRYRIEEFLYCPHEGYLVSNIGKTECIN